MDDAQTCHSISNKVEFTIAIVTKQQIPNPSCLSHKGPLVPTRPPENLPFPDQTKMRYPSKNGKRKQMFE